MRFAKSLKLNKISTKKECDLDISNTTQIGISGLERSRSSILRIFLHAKHIKPSLVPLLTFLMMILPGTALGNLRIMDVEPKQGVVEQSINMRIHGEGFDENTKVSLVLDSGNHRRIVNTLKTPGTALHITVKENLLFVADGENGLVIADVTEPEYPVIIGEVDTPGMATSTVVMDNFAYVADRTEGIAVVDVSDPANPVFLESIKHPMDFTFVLSVYKNILFACNHSVGVRYYDLSDPRKPELAGDFLNYGSARNCMIDSNFLYVSFVDYGKFFLVIADIREPMAPQILSSLRLPRTPTGVLVHEGTAYVGVSDGIVEVDIHDRENPTIRKIIETQGGIFDIKIKKEYMLATNSLSGLVSMDISIPDDPIVNGSVNMPGEAYSLVLLEGFVLVANDANGVRVVDMRQPFSRKIYSNFGTLGDCKDIVVDNDFGYVASENNFQIVDISDPEKITTASILPIPGRSIKLSNSIGFLHHYIYGVFIVDLVSPRHPAILTKIQDIIFIDSIDVYDGKLYVSYYFDHIGIFDVINPIQPKILGWTQLPYYTQAIAISDNIGYVAALDGGLKVLDVGDSMNPKTLGEGISTPGNATAISVSGNLAYIADGFAGFQIVDVTNPTSPILRGRAQTPSTARKIVLHDDIAFVLDGNLHLFDILNPDQPRMIASMDTPGTASGVAVSGDNIFVADGNEGLVVLPMPMSIEPVHLEDSKTLMVELPGPSVPGHYTLRVFDDSGSSKLHGAITFSERTTKSKAIIVAGSGPFLDGGSENRIWSQTRLNANFAYKALLFQGYTHDQIYYLGHQQEELPLPGGTIPVVDDPRLTKNRLESAIRNWVSDPADPAHDLLIYLIGHGGQSFFQIRPGEILSAEELWVWLDEMDLPGRVIVILESCYSGSFMPMVGASFPAGRERVIITSASEQNAKFDVSGHRSFSYQFWTQIYEGYSLNDAFIGGRKMVENQNPLIDANNNSEFFDKEDQRIASEIYIGRGYPLLAGGPYIKSIESRMEMDGLFIRALLGDSAILPIDVVVEIIPPYHNGGKPGIPVIFPQLKLSHTNDQIYEGVYSGDLSQCGLYKINAYTTYEMKAGEIVSSIPRSSSILPNGQPIRCDLNSDCRVDLADAIISLQIVSGLTPAISALDESAYVGENQRIGLEEALYALRKAAGL